MKASFSVLVAFLILFSLKSKAQAPVFDDSLFQVMHVLEFPGVGKDELFKRAKEWVNNKYKTSSAVINFDDKSPDLYSITFEPMRNVDFFSESRSFSAVTEYRVRILVKDGKCKLELKHFYCLGLYNYKTETLEFPQGEQGDLSLKRRPRLNGILHNDWDFIRTKMKEF